MTQHPELEPDVRLLNEHDHDWDLPSYRIGVYGDSSFDQSAEMILMHEVALIIVMDRLMDERNWHREVFDPHFVAQRTFQTLARLDIPRYNLSVAAGEEGSFIFSGRYLKSLLDKRTLVYARPAAPYPLRSLAIRLFFSFF